MKQAHERNDQFERFLRDEAKRERRALPDNFTSRVVAEIRGRTAQRPGAMRAVPIGRSSLTWYRAALAAAVVIAATLVAAMTLRQTAAPIDHAPSHSLAEAPSVEDVSAGPMAILASLQRAPDDIGMAIHDVMSREMNLLIENLWNEPRQFIARLPLQGRLDHEAEKMP